MYDNIDRKLFQCPYGTHYAAHIHYTKAESCSTIRESKHIHAGIQEIPTKKV